ncbi:MAG: cytochrome c [Planctomycetota bacterium]
MVHLAACALALVLPASVPSSEPAGAELDGRELIARYGCASCHAELEAVGVRVAPDLTLSAARLDPEWMAAYIADPRGMHPDTRMPDAIADRDDEDERRKIVRLVTEFLRFVAAEGDDACIQDQGDARRGERLYHEVGCIQCHGPRVPDPTTGEEREPPDGARSLDHVADKWTAPGLAGFLHDPLAHRPGGLMPEMHLSRMEAADIAAYLTPRPAVAEKPEQRHHTFRVGNGGDFYQSEGCASCHGSLWPSNVAPPTARPGRLVEAIDAGREGCMSDRPFDGMRVHSPLYALREGERTAIRSAIEKLDAPRADEAELHATLDAFRCTACHERDGVGGVPATLDGYLATDEPDLGDYARRPPRLDGVGGKLRRTWLERVLYDGASVRPYMKTRMPVFGAENLAHLPELLETVDAEEPLTFPRPEGEKDREARDAARFLLGTTRLGCVTCHRFNAKDGPSFQGIDLVTSPERLRERWFRDALVSPQSRMPGVVMPESWPGGVAVDTETLGGDADAQIGAIWHYLTLGRSAANPRGIDQPRWDVDVEDAPRLYRGRSRVAGFRGIAVGFPEGLHYAFDANNGALAALWRGDFLSVNWNGQGAGNFFPRTKAAELARDVALLPRAESEGRWPQRPVKTEEEPVNPDPEYPRQYGYRFRGYRLDESGVPTLRYALGGVSVEDRTVPAPTGAGVGLDRKLTLTTEAPVALTFRALAGEIQDLGGGAYRSGRVTLRVGEVSRRLRSTGGPLELLLDLDLAAGETVLELSYVLGD